MTKQLPAAPHPRHLHQQAKDLLELCQIGDPFAVDQIKSHNPVFTEMTNAHVAANARLCYAQLAIARSYGFRDWPTLIVAANQAHVSNTALTKALNDPRMEELDFRDEIARRKGLPSLGTSRMSEHAVRYDVVDYMLAISPHIASRLHAGQSASRLIDLLPIISFPEMSDRLFELYIETDCVTAKPLILFDTLPAVHPATAGPGLNQVITVAGVISAIAGALLEMERFPVQLGDSIWAALKRIESDLPEAFEPAKGFVRSVLRHGYADSAAIVRVVDECTGISFAATGESFDPDKDLIVVPNVEPRWDKRPDFLSCLPLDAKLEVCREAARCGVTGRAKYDIVVRYPNYADVTVTPADGHEANTTCLGFNRPGPPSNAHRMPNAAIPNMPSGTAYIPPPRFEPPQYRTQSRGPGGSYPHGAGHRHAGGLVMPTVPTKPASPWDPIQALPESMRQVLQPGSLAGNPGHGAQSARHFESGLPDPAEEVRKKNEEIDRSVAEATHRQRVLQQQMMERHYESYSGADLSPQLTPAGEEYAKLHARKAIDAPARVRNYMAGLGRWLSQVGFAQQAAGESVYGYANNNPVTYIDPSGTQPTKAVPASAPQPGWGGPALPGALTGCLTLSAQATLLAKFRNARCSAAIARKCGGQLPLVALSNSAVVPLWKFPAAGGCDPGSKGWIAECEWEPRRTGGYGDPCKVTDICVDQSVCNGSPELGACAVIWEMTNACQCAYWGNDSLGLERDARVTQRACGCVGKGGGPGGRG